MFKITPRFKAQTEGSLVQYTHKMHIESVKQRGFMLHVSSVTYSNVPALYDRRIPKSLQLGKVKEANVSTEVYYVYYDYKLFSNVKYIYSTFIQHIFVSERFNSHPQNIHLYQSINQSIISLSHTSPPTI
jgi:hypothetical protein